MNGLQKIFKDRSVFLAVLVAGLGYFVDIYDLILFGIVRKPSLEGLGFSGEQIRDTGILLINLQMTGMLLGGLLWGILGDKKGRLKMLFASIILYSVANVLNGLINDIPSYAVLRFIAGVGLAGELGVGITLVSELMDKESRGWGTTIVATLGLFGAVAAHYVVDYDWNLGIENWRIAYFVGGILGFLLLLLRVGVHESPIFDKIKDLEAESKGNLKILFASKERITKFFATILIGVPIWYYMGILVFFSLELAKYFQLPEEINIGKAISLSYIGIAIGDFSSGALSQILRSRKKAIFIFLTLMMLSSYYYLFFMRNVPVDVFYVLCFTMGFFSGYWAVFITTAAEQFGTNIRATVTTAAPNFVRGSLVLITTLFQFFNETFGNEIHSAALVGAICFAAAYWALLNLKETYAKDLDYLEK